MLKFNGLNLSRVNPNIVLLLFAICNKPATIKKEKQNKYKCKSKTNTKTKWEKKQKEKKQKKENNKCIKYKYKTLQSLLLIVYHHTINIISKWKKR